MIKKSENFKLKIGKNNRMAENAALLGNVALGDNVSIWYGACIRGDSGDIIIGNNTNIQDNATIHAKTTIKDNVSIGHNAVIHGCTIEDNCLIGMHATVLNNAIIGENSMLAAGSLVTQGKIIPPNSLVMGVPGKVVRELTQEEIEKNKQNASHYVELAKLSLEKIS